MVDLRVEDHREPLKELRRLVQLGRAYQRMNAGDEAVAQKNINKAREEYGAAERMLPDGVTNGEIVFWHAVTLANTGRVDESLPLFRRAFAQDRNWAELVRRLPKAGQLPDDARVIDRIVAVSR